MATKSATASKGKRKNSERRKEKSRDAARHRRGKETEIFLELTDGLPLPCNVRSQLDKTSVMRLAVGYIKIQHLMDRMNLSETLSKSLDKTMDRHFLKALEGFLFVLSSDGDILYLSENVNRFLGLTQIDLVGHSIFDFSHPCDHNEIKEMLMLKPGQQSSSLSRNFFIRMKCTLTNKGKNVNMKSAAYKVIHCTGHMVCDNKENRAKDNTRTIIPSLGHCLISVGEPIPHPADIEIPLDKQTFLSRHNLDMTFTYVDDRISQVLGYSSDDLLGKSVYKLHHAQDSEAIEKCFKTLFAKGQCETECYRFLAKHGGYVWVLTQATIIYGTKVAKPHCVVCINYILSDLENANELLSEDQVKNLKPVEPQAAASPSSNSRASREYEASSPLPSTNTIFAPRTEDMNKGFLMFLDDDSGYTVLKEEPEDLTHLAPTAGDVCIPLDVPTFSDMFEDVVFTDSFCDSGLIADFSSLVEEVTPSKTSVPLTNDPFLNFRADRLSPSDSEDAPELCRSSSVSSSDLQSSSANSPLHDHEKINNARTCDRMASLGFKLESTNIFSEKSPNSDLEVDEFELRAPYIPMGIGDDLPLLTPADHLWDQTSESPPPKPKALNLSNISPSGTASLIDKSSLAQLLQSSSLLNEQTRNILHVENGNLTGKNGISRLKNDTNAICQTDSRFRSEFDGGGGMSETNSRLQTMISEKNSTSKNKVSGSSQSCTSDVRLLTKRSQAAQKRCRELSTVNGGVLTTKRAKIDFAKVERDKIGMENQLKSKNVCTEMHKTKFADSVLMNLLVSGQDLSHGYSCYTTKDEKMDPHRRMVESLHCQVTKCIHPDTSGFAASLLNPEGPAIPSLLDITQLDMEVNAPIHTSQHLLQGQELLNALDTTLCSDDSFI